MQHYYDMPMIPTVTAEETVKLSWLTSSVETMKAVRELYLSIKNTSGPIEVDGVYRVMLDLTALWNAGRVQGIREERARQKLKNQTTKQ